MGAAIVGSFDNIDEILPDNRPPEFTSPPGFIVDENQTHVGAVAADDSDGDAVSYGISGGADAAFFTVGSATGELSFLSSPDFETPLDADGDNVYEVTVSADDGNGGSASQLIAVTVSNLASISGNVFLDVNRNSVFEANEPGIDGAAIRLTDEFGVAMLDSHGEAITAVTSSGGFYLFEDLGPGTYQLHEVQPTGVSDGAELVGSLGGMVVTNDVIQLHLERTDAFDYVFSELGQAVASGDSAGIGYWQNKHGQSLITHGGADLAYWLTDNYSNVFGDSLAGADGAGVASFYRNQLFKQKAEKGAGPAKVDAQFMAVALATYFTNRSLAGEVAASFGFTVTDTGLGARLVNVGNHGAAFDVGDGEELTVLQLLSATDRLTDNLNSQSGFAIIYDRDGNGIIDSQEAVLRSLANQVYSWINEQGEN